MTIPTSIPEKWITSKGNTPQLFRYLEQKYIDQFFNRGLLKLSSFQKFAKHPDEQRRDTQEGQNVLHGFGPDRTVLISARYGRNAFILSTSAREDEELLKTFSPTYNGYFRIKHSTNFGKAIANRIRDFVQGFEGFCIYADQKIMSQQLSQPTLDDLETRLDSGSLSLDNIFATTSELSHPAVYFTKHSRYSHQYEYRFVWIVSYDVPDGILVECPEAIQYCEKVT